LDCIRIIARVVAMLPNICPASASPVTSVAMLAPCSSEKDATQLARASGPLRAASATMALPSPNDWNLLRISTSSMSSKGKAESLMELVASRGSRSCSSTASSPKLAKSLQLVLRLLQLRLLSLDCTSIARISSRLCRKRTLRIAACIAHKTCLKRETRKCGGLVTRILMRAARASLNSTRLAIAVVFGVNPCPGNRRGLRSASNGRDESLARPGPLLGWSGILPS